MATKLIITPNTTSISATSNTTTLTISSAVGGAASDASGVAFSGAVPGFDGANNSVKDALNYLASILLQHRLQLMNNKSVRETYFMILMIIS